MCAWIGFEWANLVVALNWSRLVRDDLLLGNDGVGHLFQTLAAVGAAVLVFGGPALADGRAASGTSDLLTIVYTDGYHGRVNVNGKPFLSIPLSFEEEDKGHDPFITGYRHRVEHRHKNTTLRDPETYYAVDIVPTNTAPFQAGKNTVTVTYTFDRDKKDVYSFFAMSQHRARIHQREGVYSKRVSFSSQFIYGLRVPDYLPAIFQELPSTTINETAKPKKAWEMEWTLHLDPEVAGAIEAGGGTDYLDPDEQ